MFTFKRQSMEKELIRRRTFQSRRTNESLLIPVTAAILLITSSCTKTPGLDSDDILAISVLAADVLTEENDPRADEKQGYFIQALMNIDDPNEALKLSEKAAKIRPAEGADYSTFAILDLTACSAGDANQGLLRMASQLEAGLLQCSDLSDQTPVHREYCEAEIYSHLYQGGDSGRLARDAQQNLEKAVKVVDEFCDGRVSSATRPHN